MNVFPIKAFTDNYIWAITDDNAGVFDCVDPGDAEPVLHFAQSRQLKLRTILLTHHHHDHIGGVEQLLKAFPDVVIYAPNDSRIPMKTDEVRAGQIIQVGLYSFHVLFNPGHTSTHISYYEPQQGWLFCGDTLFSAGCGRVFDGTMEELHASLQMFKSLPPTTKVFCAHEYTVQNLRFAEMVEPQNQRIKDYLAQLQESSCTLPSNIEVELAVNPFLRTQADEVVDFALRHGAGSVDSLAVFRVLRMQKNTFI